MISLVGQGEPVNSPGRGIAVLRLAIIVAAGLYVAACTQTKAFHQSEDFVRPGGVARVLLMPPDVELYELTAVGLPEPKADWTQLAKTNMQNALGMVLQERQANILFYGSAKGKLAFDDAHLQTVKLHSAVGKTILVHKYIPGMDLPTKKEIFDWSLGEGATVLRDSFDADYALFVYFRESFSSAGRVATNIIMALLGGPIRGGVQLGFASLVDLRTGDIVWFNRLRSETGDLRKVDSARSTLDKLLSEFPL
jgi:hypothetical protein